METEKNNTENKKQKRQKIFEILKKIGIALTIIIGIIILSNQCYKKTHAKEPIPNYNIYTNVGQISTIEEDEIIQGLYLITFENERIYYYYNDGNYETTVRYRHYQFTLDEDELQYEIDTTLKIEISELQTGVVIYFGGYVDNEAETYQINRITTLPRYLDKITDTAYSDGYSAGNDTTDPNSAYNQGRATGRQETLQEAQDMIDANTTAYQNEIQGYKDLIKLMEETAQQGGNWAQLKNILGLIFLYPIRFIKEGMNVELYGVNIGGLILGVFMIGLTLTITGILLGRRNY